MSNTTLELYQNLYKIREQFKNDRGSWKVKKEKDLNTNQQKIFDRFYVGHSRNQVWE